MTDAALPTAEVAHAMPGRARLRFPDQQGDAAFFASVASGLSAMPGVYKIATTPLTGSVLIEHGGPLEKISSAAREAGLFNVGKAPAPEAETPVELDPKLLVSLGLAGLALWQMSREKFFPPALTLLWYASHLSGIWGRGMPEGGE